MSTHHNKTLKNQLGQLQDVAELLPAGLMILRMMPEQLLIEFCSGIRPVDITPPASNDVSRAKCDLIRYIPVPDRESFMKRIAEKTKKEDPAECFSLFQQLSPIHEGELKWHLFSFKLLTRETNGDEIILSAIITPISAEDNTMKKVLGILEENKLIKKYFPLYITLTQRERQVLNLLADGKTAKSIAGGLFISLHTAETHCKKIKAKLGAGSRMEMMQIARLFTP